jgi:hypothetical protein
MNDMYAVSVSCESVLKIVCQYVMKMVYESGENEEVLLTLVENLLKMRCFFLAVGLWAGTAREKWPG